MSLKFRSVIFSPVSLVTAEGQKLFIAAKHLNFNHVTKSWRESLLFGRLGRIQLKEVVLFPVIEHGMTPFRFQTAQKNPASLRSSVRQFEKTQ